VYFRESKVPAYLIETQAFDPAGVRSPGNLGSVLLRLLGSPNIASKHWVYEQYDSMVRTNSVILAEGDAAVMLVKESGKALSMTTDCNGRYVYLNPRLGSMIAVAEAARNVVCTGARPLAITNCLNFGNPYKPEVYWQFKEAVAGIGEACGYFNTPVTGGNVSFYNESPSGAVFPTPVIGMLGLIEDVSQVLNIPFKNEGDAIILFGVNYGHLGGSEYLATVHGICSGNAPALDLGYEKSLHEAILGAMNQGLLKSAHDCAEGGLAVAIAECCITDRSRMLGAKINVHGDGIRPDGLLFGEDQSRVVVSCAQADASKVLSVAHEHGVDAALIGYAGGDDLCVNEYIQLGREEMAAAYFGALGSLVDT
jgi:phosphoribosylformylglycinamidine synthase